MGEEYSQEIASIFFMGEKDFQEFASNSFMGEKYSQEFASNFFMVEKYVQEFASIFFMGGPHVGPPTWAPRGPTHLGPGLGPGAGGGGAGAGAACAAGQILRSQPDPSPNAPRDQIRRKDPCCDYHRTLCQRAHSV